MAVNPFALPQPYWKNTSSNAIVKELIEHADSKVKAELEQLIAGGSIEKPVHEDITYGKIYDSEDNLWNFLFFTGYLKKTSIWMEEAVFQKELSVLLMNSISYMDGREAFYHGFVLSILENMKDYLVSSNREGGLGRYDIAVRSLDVTQTPVILELKISETFKGLEAACDEALRQIEEKRYNDWLPEEGYTEVLDYSIAFFKKQCRVKAVRKKF